MIHLALDEEQEAVAEMTHELGMEVLSPAGQEADTTAVVPRAVWTSLLQTGLTAPLAEDAGGGGVPDPVTQVTAIYHLAHGDAGITLAALWSGAASFVVSLHGSAAQKAAFRGTATDADARGSVALYEGYGRGATELATTIEQDGDQVRVVGSKVAVPHASTAESFIVIGVDPQTHDLRAAIVPRGADGVSIAAGDRALALDQADLASADFDVVVPVDQLLDAEGLVFSVERLRLAVAAAQTGMAQRAMEYAAEYATGRIAFGQPIASFQGISFPLSEAFSRTEQARLEILDAASLLRDQADPERVSAAVSAAVAYASENAAETTRHAVQVLGGHGFMTEYPVEQWYRTAAFLSALDFDPRLSAFHPVF